MSILHFLVASIFIGVALTVQTCDRCVCPCSQSYCTTVSSKTWNSSYSYSVMGYTKLVLALDGGSCKPCPYSCKVPSASIQSCLSENYTSCTACMSEFYLASTSPTSCRLCGDRCTSCSIVNNISSCSVCSTGSYLDSASGICRACSDGAYSCDSLQITACLVGYYQVSPIVCIPCSSNCQQCSTNQCSVCNQGYYKNSTGGCQSCNSSLTCLSCVTATACSSCSSGYYLTATSPKRCSACFSNCALCNSSTCTQCSSGYYLSGNACVAATALILQCNEYSTASVCASCKSGFYLFAGNCLPCSINCLTCTGSAFGQCISCQSGYQLYNLMCLPNNFPTRLSYRTYYHLPSYAALFSGGSLTTCIQSAYSGTSISIQLDQLAASSITVTWKIYVLDAGATSATYSVSLNGNSASNFTADGLISSICGGSASQLYHVKSTELANITISNKLTFNSSSSIAVAEIGLLCVRCKALCLVCTATVCSKCSLSTLFTELDSCVYACSNSYYTYAANSSCLTICPSRTYPINSSLVCIDCSSPCYTCTSNVSCLSCVTGYYLYNNSCQLSCPAYYYANNVTKTCEKCVGRCLTCLSATSCLSCSVGFLTGNQCVDNCTTFLAGTYSDIPTLQCQSCSANCQNCSDAPTRCIACPTSQPYLVNDICYSVCPAYTYPFGGSCLACSYPCLSCTSTSINCTSCAYNYYFNNSCVSNCPDGYYEQTSNLTCVACQMGCSQCAYRGDYCQLCLLPYLYFNATCLTNCPSGYYANTTKCQKCVSPCHSCSNATFCLSCLSNFLNQSTGLCVGQSQCADGYYADIGTLKCQTCASPCLKCSVLSTLCTACSSPLLLSSSNCTSSCLTGFYANQTTSKCSQCLAPCLTCNSSIYCLSCISGYLYSNSTGQCLSYCNTGEYIDLSTSRCLSCGTNCLSCKLPNNCQQCSYSSYLYPLSGICISDCSIVNNSYFSDSTTSKCLLCIQPCLTCSSIADCTSCVVGVLYQNRCVGSCPLGTYKVASGACLNCSVSCFSCFETATNCTSCINQTYLLFNQCLMLCPLGYYPEQVLGVCSQCNSRCLNCTNYTYCLNCQEGYLDLTHNCVDACSYGYYAQVSNRTCMPCDSSCLSCVNTSTNCISCSTGYLLVQLTISNSVCLLSCKTGQYSANGICYACSPPCLECTSSSSCLSCINGTIFIPASHACVSVCPLSTFESAGQCKSCSVECSTCSAANYCLTCLNTSLYVYMGGCYQVCPSQYYGDNITKMCVQCISPCFTCTDKFKCVSCASGYLLDGYCYELCPPGTFSNLTRNACDPCTSPCLTCVINSAYCTKCIQGHFIYNGSCQSSCPNGSYVVDGYCEVCPYPCLTCLNSVVCTSCLGGFLNYLNATCISGPTCPNDLYNMDGIACVRANDCPSSYYKDTQEFTCSSACNLGKYTYPLNTSCINSCPEGFYVDVGLVCRSFDLLNSSLMGGKLISFVKSSGLYLEVLFNETAEWVYPASNTSFTVNSAYRESRLLLAVSQGTQLGYSTTTVNEKIELLNPVSSPWVTIKVPAYYVRSQGTKLPFQTPNMTVKPHPFAQYSTDQKITGTVLNQLSQSISIIIIIVSVGFIAINRLSDVYIIWDLSQLLYLLIFLDVQYPPNLNEFVLGLKGTHLYLLPNMFQLTDPRQNSSSPYYAYAYDVNFLRSAAHNFVLVLFVLGCYAILKLLQLMAKRFSCLSSNDTINRIVYKGLLRFRWHYINDLCFLTFLNVVSFGVAQTQDLNTKYQLFPLTAALILLSLICYIGFPLFVAVKLYRHFGNIAKGKHIENLKCFYRGIEKTNKFGVALILLRYFRKLLFALVVPLLSAKPELALPILTLSSVLLGIFIFVHRPFKKRISNIVNVITQALLVCLFFIISVIYFMTDENIAVKWVLGWVAVLLLAAILFGQMFYIFCKTLFYLEPQRDPSFANVENQGKDPLAAIRKNRSLMVRMAEQFFNKMFPTLKHNFSLQSSDEQEHSVQEGDSQNSQNNDYFKRAMNLQDDQSSNCQQFQHYPASEVTSQPQKSHPPQYLVRCVQRLPV